MALPATLLQIARALLEDRGSDPALLALAITPPDAAYVAALEPVLDVDGVVAARAFLMRELALALRPQFEAVYAQRRVRATYAPTSDKAGARKLANMCLHYLARIDDAAARALAVAHYDGADNMTDSYGALLALRDSTGPERDALYARFETRWRDEPLVLDKWFALEATAERDDALARVSGRACV